MNEPKSNGERVVTLVVGAAFLILPSQVAQG